MKEEINNLTIIIIAVVLTAVVVKVVAICIHAQQQEDGEKSIWEKIKKVVLVGIIALCITGFTNVITAYYLTDNGGGQHVSSGGFEHGGGGGYH